MPNMQKEERTVTVSYDQQAVTAVLTAAADGLTAAELAKILHWPRTRTRKALFDLEADGHVTHNNRTWKYIK